MLIVTHLWEIPPHHVASSIPGQLRYENFGLNYFMIYFPIYVRNLIKCLLHLKLSMAINTRISFAPRSVFAS